MAQANEFNYLLAKTAWMSSGKYLLLIKKLIENCDALETGNLDTMMNEGVYKDYAEENSEAKEGQNDARSLVPFIYSVYNSVEQLLLAYYYAGFPDDKLTFVPTFVKLEEKFDEYNFAQDEPAIIAYVHKFSRDKNLPDLIKKFLDASGYDANFLKTTRRAVENNNLFNVLDNYQPYYFTAEEGKQFFAQIYDDVNDMLVRVNRLIDDIDDDGNVGELVASLKIA